MILFVNAAPLVVVAEVAHSGINSVLWCGLFCLATNQIAQMAGVPLPPVIHHS